MRSKAMIQSRQRPRPHIHSSDYLLWAKISRRSKVIDRRQNIVPRIFDNIDNELLPGLREAIGVSDKADFCVGYFNLRVWKKIDDLVEAWDGGDGRQCRLLVGMQKTPADELRAASKAQQQEQPEIDNKTAAKLKREKAEEFARQLTTGLPNKADKAGLQRLVAQLKAKKVCVKLFLRYLLHAKLYLCFRTDPTNPITAFVGSSNLSFSGLLRQGELNVDVLDHDATQKLAKWFEKRWEDQWCLDISEDLIEVIEESWARSKPLRPYDIYVKMAYHLSQEARDGLNEFKIPGTIGNDLFDYQEAAVKIAANYLNKRGGVLIGDVVGLGKTLMATALAKIFQEDYGAPTLIICPKNLKKMWDDYATRYELHAKILSLTEAARDLPNLKRYHLVLIDESHNLRNREGKRYRVIHEYIMKNESSCILLSATPYNKNYVDLSNQLRLFIPENKDIGLRPEKLIDELGEAGFTGRHQCPARSLAAFEKSNYPDDWRELMRLYMVRRTRSFIQENYAFTDSESGRKYLVRNEERMYFPTRTPETLPFKIDERDPNDQYARLYADSAVEAISEMHLPRYGLGNYKLSKPVNPAASNEIQILGDLSRAGKRLIGFCRTNIFKRLESSGQAFQQSIERHALRNFIFLHAIETGQDLPIGPQDAALLDTVNYDDDADSYNASDEEIDDSEEQEPVDSTGAGLGTENEFRKKAKEAYSVLSSKFKRRFKWLRPDLFDERLAKDLKSDNATLLELLAHCGPWEAANDRKLDALHELVSKKHPNEKVLVFSQFADTVKYLETSLHALGVAHVAGVTGKTSNPTEMAWRFSPTSNHRADKSNEIRVLITTDVLSEGQNLQDAAIIVNYDLPWAIIRIIQRAGRVDRIGQKAPEIMVYSFLPAEGVERVLSLRSRVQQRLREHGEVLDTDEAFFEDEAEKQKLSSLYNEKAGILDGEAEGEVDLASYAYQIWKNAIDAEPSLAESIPALRNVVYSTKHSPSTKERPDGVLLYLKTAQGNDALTWIDKHGKTVSQSQFEILKAAASTPETPCLQERGDHHDLVAKGVALISSEEKDVGGHLGNPSGPRARTYERLKAYAEKERGSLFNVPNLEKAIELIYRYPLNPTAARTLSRQLRSGVEDKKLSEMAAALYDAEGLCLVPKAEYGNEPQILCSLGLEVPD